MLKKLVFLFMKPFFSGKKLSAKKDIHVIKPILYEPEAVSRWSHKRALNWLYAVNMEISMVKTKAGCYGNQILALQPCGGNPYCALKWSLYSLLVVLDGK